MKAILFFLLFFSFLNLYSQNETGVRTGSRDRMYLVNSINLYPLEVPIIRSIPPIDSSMPFEVRKAYKITDLLARKYSTKKVIQLIEGLSFESKEYKTILKNMTIIRFIKINGNLIELLNLKKLNHCSTILQSKCFVLNQEMKL